jgi:polar amino acid transport system substrate-binding protein
MGIARIAVATLVACAVWSCASIGPESAARHALAPTGPVRVALFEGNAIHAVRDRSSGAVKGVSHDLGRELAARLGVEFEPVYFSDLGVMLDAGKAGKWDVAFLAMTPERAQFLDFTPNHIEVEYGYLVPANSAIASVGDVDRPGVRVAVVNRGSPDMFLTRELRNATLVRAPGLAAAVEMVRERKADLIAGQKPAMHGISGQLGGARVLEGSPGTEGVAVALPKGRDPAALAEARAFIEQAKAGGIVRDAIARNGLKGVVVARGH